jgi:hypothetical protein
MNKSLVKQIIEKPRMPKRPSTSVTGTGTTYRASKAQTLLLHALDRKAAAAEVKKAQVAEVKKARADKKAEAAERLAHRKAQGARDRVKVSSE